MSKRKQALEAMELDGPALSLVPQRQGKRPGRLALDRMRPNPDQPRRHFDAAAVLQLAADIAENGLLEPIVVGPPDDEGIHTIVAGERRWRACQKADKAIAEVVIDYGCVDPDDMFDAALRENIQREDLTRQDLAGALQRVKHARGLTDEQLAEKYHKSTDWVRQVLAFADLDRPAQDFMEDRNLPLALAKAIRPIAPEHQLDILRAVEPLTTRREQMAAVSELKDLVRRGASTPDAVHVVGRRTRETASAPTRITLPFVWDDAGDVRFLRVQFSALSQSRLMRTQSGPAETWITAVAEDLTALRDACADHADGTSVWDSVQVAMRSVLNS
jgi:ParB/RepB/Spo0J family partition protein